MFRSGGQALGHLVVDVGTRLRRPGHGVCDLRQALELLVLKIPRRLLAGLVIAAHVPLCTRHLPGTT
ncbi:MAG TPA: hypothetical protein VFC00_40325 [Micromonosporaceae bacterium]|nr:hypothetical protein [Micromonosporaceae bacterium]